MGSVSGLNRRAFSTPLYQSLGLFVLNFFDQYISGRYVHKLFLRGEYDEWLNHRLERYHTRKSRLQLVHVPRAFSSHSEQSVAIAGTEVYNATPLETISRKSCELMKYHHKTHIMSMMQM